MLAAALCAVGFSSFAVAPEAVQLWEGGPYWATVNVGASEVQDHPEYGGLYKFDDDEAKNAAEPRLVCSRCPGCGVREWDERNVGMWEYESHSHIAFGLIVF